MWAGIAKVKKPFSLGNLFYKPGDEVTITHGVKCKYAAWVSVGVYDLPNELIDESSITELVKDNSN